MRRLLLGMFMVAWWMPSAASAATVFFQPATSGALGVGDTFDVFVSVDQAGESVNAVEGTVRYDPSKLMLNYVFDADSTMTLWVERPHDDDGDGTIPFSGITPGGFPQVLVPSTNGVPAGTVFTLRFSVIASGVAEFSASDVVALLNDGFGTSTETSVVPLSLALSEHPAGIVPTDPADTEPPAPFAITILNDPLVFEGDFSAIFSTLDGQSSVDQYLVDEGDGFAIAESPYRLTQQFGVVHLRVRAVDQFGNVREESVWRVLWTAEQRFYGILGAIAFTVIIVSALVWRRLRQRTSVRR